MCPNYNSYVVRKRRSYGVDELYELVDDIKFINKLVKKEPRDCRRLYKKLATKEFDCLFNNSNGEYLIIQYQFEAANNAYALMQMYKENERCLCSIILNNI